MNMENGDKFVPLTLKKERGIGFKIDIDRLYIELLSFQQGVYGLKLSDFKLKWLQLKMNVLPKCRDESEDAVQYFSLLYQTIIKKYYSCQNAKVFGVYCLIFVYWCSCQKVQINIDASFSQTLKQLLQQPGFLNNTDAVRAIKSLFPLLCFGSKTGVKSLYLSQNGEAAKKVTIPEIEVDDYQPISSLLEISDLTQTVQKYQKLKKKKPYKDLTLNLNKTNRNIAESIESLLEKLTGKNLGE